jgi:hypothetical protein
MLEAARVQAQKQEPLGFGYWAVEVARDGRYRVTMQFDPPPVLDAVAPWRLPLKTGEAFLRVGSIELSKLIPDGAASVAFDVNLHAGQQFLSASLTGQREDGIEVSPFFVEVERLET